MKIREAIDYVDRVKKNSYSASEKIHWLSDLDAKAFKEVILTHEGYPEEPFSGYTDETDTDIDLLIPDPWARDIYNFWLQACIDKENGEIQKYNVSATLYQEAYKEWYAIYNRTHMPITKCRHFRF